MKIFNNSAAIGLPPWLSGKESACSAGDPASIPESGRTLGGGHGNLLQYSGLVNPTERHLSGYSPYGHKESDMTETCIEKIMIKYKSNPKYALYIVSHFNMHTHI